jgi:hypothetical protein
MAPAWDRLSLFSYTHARKQYILQLSSSSHHRPSPLLLQTRTPLAHTRWGLRSLLSALSASAFGKAFHASEEDQPKINIKRFGKVFVIIVVALSKMFIDASIRWNGS